MKLKVNKHPEDVYQRILSFTEDNLLKANGTITHHSKIIKEDKDISLSFENLIVLLWLKLTHQELPKLMKQWYETELRLRTLKKTEISQSIMTLLDESSSSQKARIMGSIPNSSLFMTSQDQHATQYNKFKTLTLHPYPVQHH